MLDLIICPDPACGAFAELVDRGTVLSTDGPVEIIRTLCLHRHIFVLPVELLRGWSTAGLPVARPDGTQSAIAPYTSDRSWPQTSNTTGCD